MHGVSGQIYTLGEAASGAGGASSNGGIGDALQRAGEVASTVWNFKLFTINDTDVTVDQLVIAAIVLVVGLVAARVVSRHVGQRVLPRMKIDRGPASAIQTIIYYVSVVLVVMLAMNMAAVPLTVFTIFGGAMALGIGFGSQNIVNNFISGLILLIERPLTVGQLVEVGGMMGVVQKIGARSTTVQGYDGKTIVIPNSTLLEQAVTNYDRPDEMYRSQIAVGVAYGSDTKAVRDLLERAGDEHKRVLDNPSRVVLFKEFGDNALAFELHCWIRPSSVQERYEIESDLRFRIDELCREAGVTIAFPQRDVHLDTLAPLEVRVTQAG
ncbi:MAG: mechanosensitive ion channel [Phycisphaerales bacterium]